MSAEKTPAKKSSAAKKKPPTTEPPTPEPKAAAAAQAEPAGAEPSPFAPGPDAADEVVDELLGDDVDWHRLVRKYPGASLAVAFVGGCWLGLRHGPAVFSAVTGYLTSEATRRVQELLGDAAP